MVNKLALFFILLVLFAADAQAQQTTNGQHMLQKITGYGFKNYYQQYDGNPYFNNHWTKASVKLLSSEIYKGLLVKLDIYNTQLISYNKPVNRQIIVDNSIIDEIYLYNTDGEQTHLIKNVYDTNSLISNKYCFYFVLLNDSISVWRKSEKLIEKYASLSDNPNMIGRFYTKNRYYFVKNDSLISISTRKKKLAKEFVSNKKEILKFINKYKYKPKNEADVIAIFKYINALEKREDANNL